MPSRQVAARALPLPGRAQTRGGKRVSPHRRPARTLIRALLALSCLAAASVPASARADSARQQIERAATAYVEKLIADTAQREGWHDLRHTLSLTTLGDPDALPACSQTLEVVQISAKPSPQERLRLELRCADTPGWTQTLSTQQNLVLPVLVLAVAVERGQAIESRHLAREAINVSRAPRGFMVAADEALGMIAKRRLRAGQLLTPSLLDAALAVRRGQSIRLVAEDQGVVAATQGEALADGHIGASIKVRNLASKRIVDARITAPGEASTLLRR